MNFLHHFFLQISIKILNFLVLNSRNSQYTLSPSSLPTCFGFLKPSYCYLVEFRRISIKIHSFHNQNYLILLMPPSTPLLIPSLICLGLECLVFVDRYICYFLHLNHVFLLFRLFYSPKSLFSSIFYLTYSLYWPYSYSYIAVKLSNKSHFSR